MTVPDHLRAVIRCARPKIVTPIAGKEVREDRHERSQFLGRECTRLIAPGPGSSLRARDNSCNCSLFSVLELLGARVRKALFI